ncbi:MAG: hypothetical protein OEX08_00010 [Candidatus Nomurabacteria bacterium]|nr:hypothetical protein [Candidatus Nomurabacteria bacterium]
MAHSNIISILEYHFALRPEKKKISSMYCILTDKFGAVSHWHKIAGKWTFAGIQNIQKYVSVVWETDRGGSLKLVGSQDLVLPETVKRFIKRLNIFK